MWRSVGSTAIMKVLVMGTSGLLGILTSRMILSHYGTDAYAQYGLLASLPALLPFADLGIAAVGVLMGGLAAACYYWPWGEPGVAPMDYGRAVAFSLLVGVALAHHWILVGDEWSGVSFSKEQLAEEASQAICAYLGLKPTISIVDNQRPDLARTGVLPVDTPIEHLKTDECVAIDDDEPPPTR